MAEKISFQTGEGEGFFYSLSNRRTKEPTEDASNKEMHSSLWGLNRTAATFVSFKSLNLVAENPEESRSEGGSEQKGGETRTTFSDLPDRVGFRFRLLTNASHRL